VFQITGLFFKCTIHSSHVETVFPVLFFFSIERTLLQCVVQIDAVLESCVSFVMIIMNLQSSIITRTFYLLCDSVTQGTLYIMYFVHSFGRLS
jgi:hypothetical protein